MKTKPEKSKKHKEEFDEIEEQTENLASENPEDEILEIGRAHV